jgi:glycerol-3-phosphate acyltransferase PlsY
MMGFPSPLDLDLGRATVRSGMAQTIGWPALAALVLGYALGSIPFGLLLTRLAGTQDIRAIGSGSIGATNVLRTGRKGLAAATLLCDVLKGTAAVALAAWLFGRDPALAAGLGAFLGHLFPVWLRFKGGKGVATYIGILIGVAVIGASWIPLALFLALWLAVAAVTRYSSLAGLIACAATPAALWATGDRREAGLFLMLTLLVFIMHRANIARLINGSEGKINFRKSS